MVSDRYDVIVVDAGHAVTPVSMAVLDQSDKITVVTQPRIAYARNGRSLSTLLHALHYTDDRCDWCRTGAAATMNSIPQRSKGLRHEGTAGDTG